MHHCLQICEILELIFNSVFHQTQDHKPVVDRLSILAVLKTCRSFSGHAFKLLWKDLEDIGPLLLAMPEDLVHVEQRQRAPFNSKFRFITFRREILPGDWERFDFYAPFVKTLGLGFGSRAPLLTLDLGVELELFRRGRPLLPNLTALEDTTGNPCLTRRLLNPRTQWLDLKINASYGVSSICLLVDDLPTRTPLLKSFYLSQSDFRDWQLSEADKFLPTLPALLESLELEVFECRWFQFGNDIFRKLVQMPCLRQIGLCFNLAALAEMLDLFPLAGPLWEDVYIWTDSITPSCLPQILVSLRPSRLKTFNILQGGLWCIYFKQKDLDGLVSTIASHCSPKSLTCFNVKDCKPLEPFPPAIANANLVRPLYAFSKLRELSLSVHPDFTDAEVKELTMSWPLLEDLHIETWPCPYPPRTTLRCLLWFAIYCRHLEKLSFSLKGIDTFSERELVLASNNPLTSWSVGCSTIDEADIGKVSEFIEIVFPSIVAIFQDNAYSTDDDDDDDDDEYTGGNVWKKINQIVCNRNRHGV